MNQPVFQFKRGTFGIPGTEPERDGVTFRCVSPDSVPVLVLYEKGAAEACARLPFPSESYPGALYSMKVKLPHAQQYEYNYIMKGREITDPYVHLLTGREQFAEVPENEGSQLRGIIAADRFNWKGDVRPKLSMHDTVMYELHVRGFTMHPDSGIKHKGTFRGITEKIPYLKALGINQLRLMPCYDFDEFIHRPKVDGLHMSDAFRRMIHEQEDALLAEKEGYHTPPSLNFWGYKKGFYFAPKASYASEPGNACAEFKEMIRRCHAEGIEVIMEFFFDEFADMVLITNCLNWWACEYHVDGFLVIARDAVMSELVRLPLFIDHKLIGTWFSEESLTARKNMNSCMIAESNDGFMNDCRRLLKGDDNMLSSFQSRLLENPASHGVIHYMNSHNGFTLADLVSYDRKHNEENGQQGMDGMDMNFSWNCGEEGPTRKKAILALRKQQRKNALLMTFFSQGIPMIQAGDEFGNSQGGNNNAYCLDSPVSWVDWSRKRREQSFTAFVRNLIEFRKTHEILKMPNSLYGSDVNSFGYPDVSFHGKDAWYGNPDPMNHHIASMFAQMYAGGEGLLYIAWNLHWEEHTFALPQPPKETTWRRVIDTSMEESFLKEDPENYVFEKEFTVPPRSVVVLETEKRKA